MSDPTEDTRDTVKIVILSGWSLTLLVCLTIIGAAIYKALADPNMEPLKQWAGMCLGFLLGSFVSMVKDYTTKGAT